MCLHLTMTLIHCDSVHRPASKGSTHSGQLTRTRLAGRSPLQQTADDKLGTWQGHWDSMWVYTHDTQSSLSAQAWTCNFRVMLSDNVSLAPGPARPAVKHDIIPDVGNAYSTPCPYMTSIYSVSYEFSLIYVKNRPNLLICQYCTWYSTQYRIKTFNIGCWWVGKTVRVEYRAQYQRN